MYVPYVYVMCKYRGEPAYSKEKKGENAPPVSLLTQDRDGQMHVKSNIGPPESLKDVFVLPAHVKGKKKFGIPPL